MAEEGVENFKESTVLSDSNRGRWSYYYGTLKNHGLSLPSLNCIQTPNINESLPYLTPSFIKYVPNTHPSAFAFPLGFIVRHGFKLIHTKTRWLFLLDTLVGL